jgi:predicted Zn-dependent peptidase
MSSRLFQEIREKRGLAYEVGSFLSSYRDAGLFGIYAGTGREDLRETLRLIRQETERACSDPLSEKDLRSAKELLKGQFLLGMESTDNRMTSLARSEISFGRQRTAEEIIAQIEAVSSEAVRGLANRMFRPETLSIAALGPVREADLGE